MIGGSLHEFCVLRSQVRCFLTWNSHTSGGFNPFMDLKVSIHEFCKLLTSMLLLHISSEPPNLILKPSVHIIVSTHCFYDIRGKSWCNKWSTAWSTTVDYWASGKCSFRCEHNILSKDDGYICQSKLQKIAKASLRYTKHVTNDLSLWISIELSFQKGAVYCLSKLNPMSWVIHDRCKLRINLHTFSRSEDSSLSGVNMNTM